MRSLLSGLLTIGFVTAFAQGAERQEELFASWAEAQRNVKSLVVEFTCETIDSIFDERKQTEGTLRLIRTSAGEILASYELKAERSSGLLNNGSIYLLDHDTRTAMRFDPKNGDVWRFLGQYFNPFVLLVERKRAEQNCMMEIVRQGDQYTYLKVTGIPAKRDVWFPGIDFKLGGAVLANNASGEVPKDMPRRLYYADTFRQYVFDIRAWRSNVGDAPQLQEFTKPEDRPGWKVVWPINEVKQ